MPRDLFSESVSAAPDNLPRLNFNRSSPAIDRFIAGMKVTPEGQASLLETKYGPGNVVTDQSGNIFIRDPKTNEFYPHNEEGLTYRDVLSLGQEAIRTVPTMFSGGNPLIAAGAAGVGSAAGQAVSALLPGDDQMTTLDRILDLGGSAALGGAAQKGSNMLFAGRDAIRPHNIVARYMNRAQSVPTAKAGQGITNRTGIEFTPGELTGNRGVVTVEGMLRRHPVTAEKFTQQYERQLQQSASYLDKVLNRLSTEGGGAETTGNTIIGAFDDVLDKAVNLRRAVAKRDFAVVDSAAGGQKVIPMSQASAAIDDLISSFDVPGGGDATATLVNRLKSLKSDLGPKVSAQQLGRLLEVYGRAAKGTGQIFNDIDKGQQRLVAGRVFRALQDDLDDAAASATDDALAASLKVARDNYRMNSAPISELEKSVLGRMLGGRFSPTPERIAERMLNLRGSEARQSLEILSRHNPSTAQSVKRFFVESALDKAGMSASSRQGGRLAFSPAKFITNIEKSPVWDTMTKGERSQLRVAVRALERLADKPMEGSPTAPLEMAWDTMRAMGGNMTDPVALGQITASVLVPNRAANALLTPQGRKALITMASTGTRTKAYAASLSYLAASSLAMDAMMEDNVRPSAELRAATASALGRQPRNLLR